MRLHISALESILEDANARDDPLEKAPQAESAENKGPKETISAQTVELDFPKKVSGSWPLETHRGPCSCGLQKEVT